MQGRRARGAGGREQRRPNPGGRAGGARRWLGFCALFAALATLPAAARADQTPIQPSTELDLDTPGGLIDQLYGLGNVVRVEDFNAAADDQVWTIAGTGTAKAIARFAGLVHEFGVLPGASGDTGFIFLLSIPDTGILADGPEVSFDVSDTGGIFRLSLRSLTSGGQVQDIWSSDNAANSDGADHMVTFEIVSADPAHPDNPVGSFVIGWEDLPIPSPPDPTEPDYNDLVIEISSLVPVICGDGEIGDGEACDDGNLDDGDCCSSSCQIEPAGTLCRAAVDACDVAETCDGATPVCPSDGVAGDGTPCPDGDVCNGAESCSAGACVPGVPPTCDDGNVCTDDACDPVLGCVAPSSPDGTPCLDTNLCNGDETCQAGTCTPGTPPLCGDGNPCTADGCDALLGCTHSALADGSPCEDGQLCNGLELCQAGVCTAGTPLADGAPCGDADPCNGDELCQGGVCQPGTPLPDGAVCGNGDVCDGEELCTGAACVVGAAPNCDDSKPCTADACDAITGCSHALIPDCGNPTQAVLPELECVTDNPDGSVTAHFGYRNDNEVPITIPIGPDNQLSPGAADQGQPTLFDVDRSPFYPNNPLSVTFTGDSLAWTLRGPDGQANTSTASRFSLRCPPEGTAISDAYLCYRLRPGNRAQRAPKAEGVVLEDAFEGKVFDVKRTRSVCLPEETIIGGVRAVVTDPDEWLVARKVRQSRQVAQAPFSSQDPQLRDVLVSDQFGLHQVDLTRQDSVLLPAARCNPELQTCPADPDALDLSEISADAFKCYRASPSAAAERFQTMPMVGTDEFQSRVYTVRKPKAFCARASLNDSDPQATGAVEGLMCYQVVVRVLYCEAGAPPEASLEKCSPGPNSKCGEARCIVVPRHYFHKTRRDLQVKNRLHPETVASFREQQLCVPAVRLP